MNKIYWFDCDENGGDSIQTRIDHETVIPMGCHTFEEFEDGIKRIINEADENDRVVIDTMSSLADTTRSDMKLGTDENESVWGKRNVFFADKNYMTVYEAAGRSIMRLLKNVRARHIKIVTTAHETSQRDPVSLIEKRAPAMNDALYRSLIGASSDVVRMQVLTEPILSKNGEVRHPVGTRTLQLVLSEDAVAKTHIDADSELAAKVPKFIYNPSLAKLYKTLGKIPSWICIYGPPGVGKTVLATQQTQTLEKKQENA